jgi:hypothetical protein
MRVSLRLCMVAKSPASSGECGETSRARALNAGVDCADNPSYKKIQRVKNENDMEGGELG